MALLRHHLIKARPSLMMDTAKLARKRGARRPDSATARSESALLINPLDPKHIIGVEEIALRDGAPVVSARVSFDGGASWRESWPLPMEPGWAAVVGPVLALDARGTVILAALALDPDHSRAFLVAYRSEDGGIHWSRPAVVFEGPAECCYSIAADLNPGSVFRGNVYLAADIGNTLCFARSSDGQSWSGSSADTPGPLLPGLCFYPETLVDQSGAVHIVWMPGPAGRGILSVYSVDGGYSFCGPVTVADGITSVREGLPETVPATCITKDGVAICAWADDREGRSRIYCRRSADSGRTWLGPAAGEPLVRDSASDQHEFQPHLILTAAGEICCAFYEYGPKAPGGDLLVDLVMAVSYDRGATFIGRMVLSQQPWDPAVDKPLSRGATRGALGWLALG